MTPEIPLGLPLIVAVLAGGALGGLIRWALARMSPRSGTWIANTVGSFVIGLAVAAPEVWHVALGAGFAGALSTWSTLARELGHLIREKDHCGAASYALVTAATGLLAVWLGLSLAGVSRT